MAADSRLPNLLNLEESCGLNVCVPFTIHVEILTSTVV